MTGPIRLDGFGNPDSAARLVTESFCRLFVTENQIDQLPGSAQPRKKGVALTSGALNVECTRIDVAIRALSGKLLTDSSEARGDGREHRAGVLPERADGADDRDGDQGGDQAVFESRYATFVTGKKADELLHGSPHLVWL